MDLQRRVLSAAHPSLAWQPRRDDVHASATVTEGPRHLGCSERPDGRIRGKVVGDQHDAIAGRYLDHRRGLPGPFGAGGPHRTAATPGRLVWRDKGSARG